jgi:hypothetical protein
MKSSLPFAAGDGQIDWPIPGGFSFMMESLPSK